VVVKNATVPAKTTDITLRIGFVLFLRCGQTKKCSRTSETHARTMAPKT
jgi:hypothetical protein